MFLTLNYHIINRTIHDAIAISEEAFAAQLRYLHTHDYTTLSLDQAIAIVDGKQEAPPRSVLLFGSVLMFFTGLGFLTVTWFWLLVWIAVPLTTVMWVQIAVGPTVTAMRVQIEAPIMIAT